MKLDSIVAQGLNIPFNVAFRHAAEDQPLDLRLAEDLISRTRVSRILKSYRDVPAADITAVALVLTKLAQLAKQVACISHSHIQRRAAFFSCSPAPRSEQNA